MDEEEPATFGTLLRRYRLRAGWTQEALAERAGISARAVSDLERGRNQTPHRDTLARLAAALGLLDEEHRAFASAAQPAPRRPRTDAPRAHSPAARPHNLPVQLTSFVGREHEVAAVQTLLAEHRLVTLSGPGGIGKTRLALQVAAGLLPACPHGVWLVDLAPVADAARVPRAVASTVGVREAPGRPLPATLADALRLRRLLLVLDNCEHLADACARLADALLRAGPELRLLATSREVLGIAGEVIWRVPSLPVPDLRQPGPVEEPTRCAAVRLFHDRAVAVQPAFRVTTQNAPAVAEICARLDGIPLAIELAAARVRVLPPAQLLTRLEDRFRLLTGGSRTALPRHRTLRAAVDWSYDLLTEPERALFAALGGFAGGWTLEAAEAVGPAVGIVSEEVLELLTRLADKSLVTVDPQPDGTARYRLLETLRQYAGERLAARGAAAAVRRHHAAFYLALVEAAEPQLFGAETVRWRHRLGAEQDNLRAALDWCVAGQEVEQGLRLASELAVALRPWQTLGSLSERDAYFRTLLQLPAEGLPPAVRAKALLRHGTVTRQSGDSAAGRALLEEGLALYRALGDRPGIASSLTNLGLVACSQEEYAAGRRYLEEALRLWEQLGDRGRMSYALVRLGQVAHGQGDLATAQRRYEAGRRVAREAGEPSSQAWAPYHLGRLALDRGDTAGARRWLSEALGLPLVLGGHVGRAHLLAACAALAAAEGQPARAVRLDGAAAAALVASGSIIGPSERRSFERWLAVARPALDDAARAAAFAAGQSMTPEHAVAYALEDPPDER